VNARASGVADPQRTLDALLALAPGAGGTVTTSETELWQAMYAAEARGRRLVLVGGDGAVHSAANAPLPRLPELALVPAGRANNIARALALPTEPAAALAVAAGAPARPVDALLVRTPGRALYAVEAVSAGFHAAARSDYTGENSADLRQGARALARAVRRYAPYRVRAAVDGREFGSPDAAQLFVANLPFFGFGFHVDPLADPADGKAAAILLEARGRGRLLRRLAATYRGRHLGRRGVHRLAARHVELIHPLPLVADARPLGTTTASISVAPAHLQVAA
jgi:diacylglycerol kinase family enzyme